MDEPPWKKLKLSLETPYKDDEGLPVLKLLDITPEGRHVYDPKRNMTAEIGEKLTRIFVERGVTFFDNVQGQPPTEMAWPTELEVIDGENKQDTSDSTGPTTPEELFQMRVALMQQLHIALGEMTQARDLLSQLLSFDAHAPLLSGPASQSSGPSLTATAVSKPQPFTSVQAFNTQLVIGGKDRALRKAAHLFKSSAEKMESGRIQNERYWVDALRIRRGNWGLIPAPLPSGSATGKGADRTSKDFLISFGLEESPALFRRRAIGRISNTSADAGTVEFPLRQRTRLQVLIITTDAAGVRHIEKNNIHAFEDSSLDNSLQCAQAEVVEQEIYSMLIKEAGNLPTASARVSERLIVIEAAQGIELRFELVERTTGAKCDIILATLRILLLRVHASAKARRLGRAGLSRTGPPNPAATQILQPIIDLLQYEVFCDRVQVELQKVATALQQAGISTKYRFEPVCEGGSELVALLQSEKRGPMSGEALLRIDDRHTLRFALQSPSSLIAHLPQATLSLASIPQLAQLLKDEVTICILNRICETGHDLCDRASGTWFVDLLTGRSVGRWEGCVL
ncbi:hypothetical protein OBBRIDRAFT_852282 [Obba rivulosa]|uniref:Mediator of RNA polymerase II transcription subunit 17 n=1 Tax=Obba rivulosa TaxID=1052685 RepID=A0A8E2J3Y1_9APHY|nr:hypothetical protein OBBRIDRAFT_852282 [Obba rivulosa]